MSRSWDARGIADARTACDMLQSRVDRLRSYLLHAGDPDDVCGTIEAIKLDLALIETVAIDAGYARDFPQGKAP